MRPLSRSIHFAWVAVLAVASAANAETLRDVLASHRIAPGRGLPDLDRRITSYAVEDAPDLFTIAFYFSGVDSTRLSDTLRVSAWDRRARTWAHALFNSLRETPPEWDVGSIMAVHHTDRHIFIDTHRNPSAGTLIVLTRRLVPVAAPYGWLLRILPHDVVLYHRSMVHFAPTHSAELWTWNGASGRDERLYPSPHADSVRTAYVDSARAIYQRAGEDWFRTHNHHGDPERFDTDIGDEIRADTTGRAISFQVTYGGGEGTPLALPPLDVVVRCREVGTARAQCTEVALETLQRLHPGWGTTRILDDLVGKPPPR